MYTIQELVQETGYSKWTIYFYAHRGMIPRPTRGRHALWPPKTLKMLLAFKKSIDNKETVADLAERHGLVPKPR